ncbi:MAG: NF038122 family metalloprotease [Phycisphaerae bacterium]|nr:NF038122 family metalloprotease [Phycisphaerae bacterium]
MFDLKRRLVPTALLAGLFSAANVAFGGDTVPAETAQRFVIAPDLGVVVESRPDAPAVLRATGRQVDLESQTLWHYMCGSAPDDADLQELRDIAIQASVTADTQPPTRLLSLGRSPLAAGTGLDIVWSVQGSIPTEAATALETVAQYIESKFSDDVTVTINISMFDFGNPNVIGSTGSNYVTVTYPDARDGLVADMDGNDEIQAFLPLGTTVPVRYDGASTTVTAETRVFATRANFNAGMGTTGGSAASMQFNTGFAFDYDPSNGVPGNRMCFQSVAAHEVGHALGFTSGVDFRFNDIEVLDLYRFQWTDGADDYNPDNTGEFQTTTRTASFNSPNDDAISDIIVAEHRMADGSPDQASHFRSGWPAIMDPNLAFGQTFYPEFYREADTDMFDAIGWDYPKIIIPAPITVPPPEGTFKNRYLTFAPGNQVEPVAFQLELVTGPGLPGVLGWIDAPDASGISRVVDAPVIRNWTETVVQVADCEIVPAATYLLRSTPDLVLFSNDLPLQTVLAPSDGRFWGDVVGSFDSIAQEWTGPDQNVTGQDIVAVLQRFQVKPSAPPLTWVDIHPQVPDGAANGPDILQVVNAFSLKPYPFVAPSDCP